MNDWDGNGPFIFIVSLAYSLPLCGWHTFEIRLPKWHGSQAKRRQRSKKETKASQQRFHFRRFPLEKYSRLLPLSPFVTLESQESLSTINDSPANEGFVENLSQLQL